MVTTLLLTAVLVLLGSTLATHSMVNRLEWSTRARNLAEAVVQQGRLLVNRDPTFQKEVVIQLPGDPQECRGILRFSGSDASRNNLTGPTAVPGWRGQSVPPYSVQLVGVGNCHGVEVRVNAVFRQSGFPYAVASQGPFWSSGGTRITGSLDPTLEAPADLACNAPAQDAVQLGCSSWVAGDIHSSGGILLGSDTTVRGQTLPYSAPVKLPDIDLNRYDPVLTGAPYQNLPVLLGSEVLSGECRCSTDLEVSGDLTLHGATLFVNGNLRIHGRLEGEGLVVVTGNTQVEGSTTLDTSSTAVLLGGGDISLKGLGADSSSFRGLVYAKGGFNADQISVIGTFISLGADKKTVLNNAQVVYDPGVTHLSSDQSLVLSWNKTSKGLTLNGGATNLVSTLKELSKVASQITGVTRTASNGTVDLTFQLAGGERTSSAAQVKLFDLNDFLSDGRPLELLAWRENE